MNKEHLISQLEAIADRYGFNVGRELLDRIVDISSFRLIRKGTVLRYIGDPVDTAGFVVEGMLRSYYIDGDGNDITKTFSVPGALCMDEGLLGFESSLTEWESLEDCTVMMFEVKEIRKLISESSEMKDLYISMLEISLRYKIYRENGFLVENATERYLHFKRIYPQLYNKVPQRQLATYLGIAPESLSRIKRAMREETAE